MTVKPAMALWTAAKIIVILKRDSWQVVAIKIKMMMTNENHGPKKRSTKQRIKMLNNERTYINYLRIRADIFTFAHLTVIINSAGNKQGEFNIFL